MRCYHVQGTIQWNLPSHTLHCIPLATRYSPQWTTKYRKSPLISHAPVASSPTAAALECGAISHYISNCQITTHGRSSSSTFTVRGRPHQSGIHSRGRGLPNAGRTTARPLVLYFYGTGLPVFSMWFEELNYSTTSALHDRPGEASSMTTRVPPRRSVPVPEFGLVRKSHWHGHGEEDFFHRWLDVTTSTDSRRVRATVTSIGADDIIHLQYVLYDTVRYSEQYCRCCDEASSCSLYSLDLL